MGKLKGCLLLLLSAGAAFAVSPAERLRSNYELAQKTQRLTEAVVNGDSRDIYRMFCPAFTSSHSFARFDSALARWYGGRRIVRATHKVVEVKGPSGYVSSWFVFEGNTDYDYVYQSWLRTGHGWQLVWLSRILNSGFQFGQTDSGQLVRAAEAGLDYVLSPKGLARFHAGFERPDTLVMVRRNRPGEGDFRLNNTVVHWVTMPEILTGAQLPSARFLLGLALVRIVGDVALVTVDLEPTGVRPDGRPRRKRGIEVFVRLQGGKWVFYEAGKVW
jgi:hypothetical protein